MMHDAKHHAPHNGKSEKEADRSDKQPAPWTLCNVLAQKRAKTSAAENKQQCRHRRQKNWQKNPVAVHGSLDRDWDIAVIPTKDLCISRAIAAPNQVQLAQNNPTPCHSEARSIGEESACRRQRSSRFLTRNCRASVRMTILWKSSNYTTKKIPHPGPVAVPMVYNWCEFDASVGGIYETYPRKTGWA